MAPEDLREGLVYVLTQDVTNPESNRRARNDFTKQATFKKGTCFYTFGRNTHLWAWNHGCRYGGALQGRQAEAVLPFLAFREPRTPEEVCIVSGYKHVQDDVLHALWKMGKFSLADVQAALNSVIDERTAEPAPAKETADAV